MHYLKLIFFGACLSCLALQCDKDDENNPSSTGNNQKRLPPKTQSGENTIGFKVNGEVWRPYNFLGKVVEAEYNTYYDEEKDKKESWLSIEARWHKEGNQEDFYLDMANIFSSGKFECDDDELYSMEFTESEDGTVKNICLSCPKPISGQINVTKLDTVNQVISGTFSFKAYCQQTKDTLNITDGRFDFQYPLKK